MRYISTRGAAPTLTFEEVLLAGLASDGGLYVPETLPHFSQSDIEAMRGLSYNELALRIVSPFVTDSIPLEDLKRLIDVSYADFRHSATAPMVQLDSQEWVLELFHGPTLAFKDFALQLLGRLLDYVLARRGERVVIMGATSGDTGSAAIEGCRSCDNIDIFILYPHGAVSEVQRRQMTTVISKNVHNLAIEGNFDDCQAMVKASFIAEPFLPDGRSLVAVNSINWARIMAQIVYYFYAALSLGGPGIPVSFSVPTGNFGDIFAGYLAREMGLPVDQLIIATNKNDVLHRVLTTGCYQRLPLERSLSPSMDITISSNFERLMFDAYQRDGLSIAQLMRDFSAGDITLNDDALASIRALFSSCTVSDEQTCAEIARVWQANGYLLDPHSAIGTFAAKACQIRTGNPVITLATAHPAKFPDAIEQSVPGLSTTLPDHLADLYEREESCTVLPNDIGCVQGFMADHISA